MKLPGVQNGDWDEAVRLTARPRLYDVEQRQLVVRVADGLEQRGEPFNRQEQRVIDQAFRFRQWAPERAPEPELPASYREAIAAAAAALTAAELQERQRYDAYLLADAELRETMRRTGGTPPERLVAKVQAAATEWDEARHQTARRRGGLTNCQKALDAARARARLAEQERMRVKESKR